MLWLVPTSPVTFPSTFVGITELTLWTLVEFSPVNNNNYYHYYYYYHYDVHNYYHYKYPYHSYHNYHH